MSFFNPKRTQTGGPAIFVLSWAIIKAFAVEPRNLSVDGVSVYLFLFLFVRSIACLQSMLSNIHFLFSKPER